ncbi:hypothetical protein SUGI_0609620 [Cryptomeria japonica]|nr:hypothetical protein SUGI_0609620 [Cryptomeria japonica]
MITGHDQAIQPTPDTHGSIGHLESHEDSPSEGRSVRGRHDACTSDVVDMITGHDEAIQPVHMGLLDIQTLKDWTLPQRGPYHR